MKTSSPSPVLSKMFRIQGHRWRNIVKQDVFILSIHPGIMYLSNNDFVFEIYISEEFELWKPTSAGGTHVNMED